MRCEQPCWCQRCVYLNTEAQKRAKRVTKYRNPQARKPDLRRRESVKRDPRRVGLLVHVPEPMQRAIIAAKLEDGASWDYIVPRSGTTLSVCRRIVRNADV